jgi:PAS domain S-box-containing protein
VEALSVYEAGMQDTTPTDNSSTDPKVNILLVDDQPANLLALQAILEDLGQNLVEAHSGEEALQRLLTNDFAVILLDVQMHGPDGFSTAKLIRSQERSRDTPIIFHTAPESNRLPVEEQAYTLGAVDYLVKPLVPFILRAKVAWFVELFQKTGREQRQAEQLRQTERRGFEDTLAEARTRLLEQQEWMQVTLGSVGDAVIATDPAGRVVFLNPVAQSLTGWTQQEAEGHLLETVFPVIHEETRRPVEHPVAKVIGEGAIVGLGDHAVLVARDGTERPIDDSGAPLKDGEGRITGMVLIFRDVTERRRAELRLRAETRKTREAEERLRLMVESVKDYALFSLDAQGRIVSWNTGAEHLLGYGEAEVLGKHFSIFFTPEDIQAGRPDRGLRQAATEGRGSNNNWTVRKDGSRFWAEGSTYPLRDEELRGYVTIFRDLTERKQMEEELRARAEALVEKDRRRNEFLAMLGHELRNPLAPIVTSLTVLRQEKTTSPLIEQTCTIMERQARHLVRLVDDLLDVARITRGRVELHKERVELNDLIDRSVEAVGPLVAARRHDLSVSAPRGTLWLDVDPARIQQVLVNLLANACKYTPAQGAIRLTVHREGDKVAISVKDNGVGIAPEALPKVFDLFSQAERSLARSEGGLGIGLTMVKSLVEMHGGSAVARSEGLGKGSEFIIRLPVVKSDQAVPVATPSRTAELPPVPPGRALRILVVDDNVDAAQSLALLLRAYGHEVVDVVHDGPSAVEAILTKKPSVVLLDIGLPGMSGYEVARRVRGREVEQPPHLIAVTGYGLESDKMKAQEVGIDHYIVKPVNPNRLHELLSMIVAKSA